MIWIILETEFKKEGQVFDALFALDGCEAFLPRAMVRHQHRGVLRLSRPLICPGYVFAHVSMVHKAMDLKYVTGAVVDDQQRLYVIPDPQMASFMATYHDWIAWQERAWQMGQRPRKGKFKRKFKLEAGDMRNLAALLFGADPETGER